MPTYAGTSRLHREYGRGAHLRRRAGCTRTVAGMCVRCRHSPWMTACWLRTRAARAAKPAGSAFGRREYGRCGGRRQQSRRRGGGELQARRSMRGPASSSQGGQEGAVACCRVIHVGCAHMLGMHARACRRQPSHMHPSTPSLPPSLPPPLPRPLACCAPLQLTSGSGVQAGQQTGSSGRPADMAGPRVISASLLAVLALNLLAVSRREQAVWEAAARVGGCGRLYRRRRCPALGRKSPSRRRRAPATHVAAPLFPPFLGLPAGAPRSSSSSSCRHGRA